MKKQVKILLSLLLVCCMLIGIMPKMTMAASEDGYEGAPEVTITLSLSADDQFMVGPESGEVMALKEMTIPYFDLALYGLEEYYFVSESYGDDGDGAPGSDLTPGTAEYAYGKVTLLHAYIYALEVYYFGIEKEHAGKGFLYDEGHIGTEVFTISGGVGSSFMNQFWGGDCNLNYYVNYKYPLASEGWGATCDQILLRDGDIVTLGHFTGWSFYADPDSIFNYIKVGEETGSVKVEQGDIVKLSLFRAGPNLGTSTDTAQTEITSCPEVFYKAVADVDDPDVTAWNPIGEAEADGTLEFDTSVLEPGEYLVCLPGQYGSYYPDEICSTPGGIKLIVEGDEQVVSGDMNGDGKIDVADVNMLINTYRSKEYVAIGDMDNDGDIDVADVNELINVYRNKL